LCLNIIFVKYNHPFFNTSFLDVKEKVVTIGLMEVIVLVPILYILLEFSFHFYHLISRRAVTLLQCLNILKALLTSTYALTTALGHMISEVKGSEICSHFNHPVRSSIQL